MRILLVAAALMLGLLSGASAQGATVVTTCGTLPLAYAPGSTRNLTVDINGNQCSSASASITFPTIGAAVPATGVYNALNVAGILRGMTGLSLGSTYSPTVAIVDGSGNQITSFGSGAVTIVDGGDVTQGAKADSACSTDTGTCTVVALVKRLLQSITTALSSLSTIATNTAASVPAGANTIGTVGQLPYPVGATPIVASITGSTGATTASLTAAASVTTYICSYSVRANATAAATVLNTLAPIASGITMTHVMWVAPLASGLGIDEQIFSPCLPASAVNTAINVISGVPGSGGTVTVTAAGYRL